MVDTLHSQSLKNATDEYQRLLDTANKTIANKDEQISVLINAANPWFQAVRDYEEVWKACQSKSSKLRLSTVRAVLSCVELIAREKMQ